MQQFQKGCLQESISRRQYKPKLGKCAAKQAAGSDTCEKDLAVALKLL